MNQPEIIAETSHSKTISLELTNEEYAALIDVSTAMGCSARHVLVRGLRQADEDRAAMDIVRRVAEILK